MKLAYSTNELRILIEHCFWNQVRRTVARDPAYSTGNQVIVHELRQLLQ